MKRFFLGGAALAAAVLAAVSPAATAAAPSPARTAGSGAATCRTAQYPVTIPAVAAGGHLTGDYCTPHRGSGTLMLLVGGGGEDADYWNMPGLPQDSLAQAAVRAGDTTLAIDRLGTGRSSMPPSTAVTYGAQVSTLHQVITTLHGQGWTTIIGVGHSLGAGALAGVAAQHPADLSALVLTGYGPQVSAATAARNALYQRPASEVDPARWGALDPGYVTVVPSGVPQDGLLFLPGTSPAAVKAVEDHQGTLSKTELSTRPQGAAATAQGAAITGNVLVLDGQEDEHYCTSEDVGQPLQLASQCATQAAFRAYERSMLPNADLTTRLAARTGHATEMHLTAPLTNRLILAWAAAQHPR